MEPSDQALPALDGHILFSYDTEVLNISIGGAALTSDRKLDVGTGLRLELDGSGEHMVLDGIVAWCLKRDAMGGHSPRGGGFRVGMQFTNILPEKVNELVSFIERHKKNEESRLGGLRFNIFSPERAVVCYQRRFRVKAVRPSGIRIETRADIRDGQRLPMEIALGGECARFQGEVAGAREAVGEAGAFIEAEVDFAEIAEAERAKLSDFMARPG
ncbi:MAG: hypothetical protein Kow0025_24270 [Thermodesulfovibrionales bacterium]